MAALEKKMAAKRRLSTFSYHFTAIVTPGWLRRDATALPIDTVNGIAAPARTVGGTIALICTRPATAPGDGPRITHHRGLSVDIHPHRIVGQRDRRCRHFAIGDAPAAPFKSPIPVT